VNVGLTKVKPPVVARTSLSCAKPGPAGATFAGQIWRWKVKADHKCRAEYRLKETPVMRRAAQKPAFAFG
jgi:hypothetical protein